LNLKYSGRVVIRAVAIVWVEVVPSWTGVFITVEVIIDLTLASTIVCIIPGRAVEIVALACVDLACATVIV